MKHKFLLLVAMLTAATGLFAQSADNEDEVIKIDKWNQNGSDDYFKLCIYNSWTFKTFKG